MGLLHLCPEFCWTHVQRMSGRPGLGPHAFGEWNGDGGFAPAVTLLVLALWLRRCAMSPPPLGTAGSKLNSFKIVLPAEEVYCVVNSRATRDLWIRSINDALALVKQHRHAALSSTGVRHPSAIHRPVSMLLRRHDNGLSTHTRRPSMDAAIEALTPASVPVAAPPVDDAFVTITASDVDAAAGLRRGSGQPLSAGATHAGTEPVSVTAAPYTLTITVHCARKVWPKSRGGVSDPYCVLSVGPHVVKTRVIANTLDPVWEQELRVPYSRQWRCVYVRAHRCCACEFFSSARFLPPPKKKKRCRCYSTCGLSPFTRQRVCACGSFGALNLWACAVGLLGRYLTLDMFDCDLVTKDNFLGRCVLSLSHVVAAPVLEWHELGRRSVKSHVCGGVSLSLSTDAPLDTRLLAAFTALRTTLYMPLARFGGSSGPALPYHAGSLDAEASDDGQVTPQVSVPAPVGTPQRELDVRQSQFETPLGDMPPGGVEVVEDAALVVMRPYNDPASSIVHGVLIVTNFRVAFLPHATLSAGVSGAPAGTVDGYGDDDSDDDVLASQGVPATLGGLGDRGSDDASGSAVPAAAAGAAAVETTAGADQDGAGLPPWHDSDDDTGTAGRVSPLSRDHRSISFIEGEVFNARTADGVTVVVDSSSVHRGGAPVPQPTALQVGCPHHLLSPFLT